MGMAYRSTSGHLLQYRFFTKEYIQILYIICHQGNTDGNNNTMRYHFAPFRMGKIDSTDNSNAGADVGEEKLAFIPAGDAKCCNHFGKRFGGFLQN